MQRRLQTLLLNLIYACGYFAGGYLGMFLAAPPSNASPVWPAAGVALAGMLLYGKVMLPGIFLGALAAQVYSFLDISSFYALSISLLIGTLVSFGSCLQAWVGSWLVKRFIGEHDPLIEEKKILNFLLLGGPVSCTIAATLGIIILYLRKVIVVDDLWNSWWTWWVGDTIGVIIFTPLILLFSGKPDSFWKPRRKFIAYPLLILLVLVVAVFKYSQGLEDNRIDGEFRRQVARLHSSLQHEMEDHIAVNQTLKALFESSDSVDEASFQPFAQSILSRYKSIYALVWVPRIINHDNKPLSWTGNTTERGLGFSYSMDAIKEDRIFFSSRFVALNRPDRRDTVAAISKDRQINGLIQHVIDSGRTMASERIHLHQGDERHFGVVLCSPVYPKSVVVSTVEQRRRYIKGVIISVLGIEEMFNAVFKQLPDVDLILTISDGERQLYHSSSKNDPYQLNYLQLKQSLLLDVSGRHWKVVYRPAQRFYANQQSWATWWLLFGGLILSGFIGLGLLLLTGRAARVEELVRIKTCDLAHANEHLNEEIAKRQKLQIEQSSRNTVLELLAQGDNLANILQRIALDAEKQRPEMLCSILLLDADRRCLYNGASPSLPVSFVKAIDGIAVGDGVASSGTAAFKKETVIVEDILTHPFWRDFKEILEETELRACWSEPIMSSKNAVLGTFAVYYKKARIPNREDIQFIKRMAQLSAVAIEQKKNESELRIAATTFQSHEGIMVIDRDGIILRVNEAFSKITGYSEQEAIGQMPGILASDQHQWGFYRELLKILRTEGRWQGEIWAQHKNGEIFPEWLMVTAVNNDRDEVSHYVAIFSDITDKKAAEKEIHDLAFFDPLTGLPNRRLLLDRLKHEIVTAKRHRRYGALFFLDLDHFKRLNDSLGHQIGDELLVQVAHRITTLLREEDTACRLGGDEFIVLVSGQSDNLQQATDHAAVLAERIRFIVNQPFMLQGSPHHFSTSIGISIYPDLTDHPEAVIQQADTAMYRAKESGRNSISFFRPSMQELADQRLILEKELREALRKNHFELFYQPQVNQHGKIISVEALIRWRHPTKGMISPAEFIPVAEDTQLIVPIGQWVMKEACRQIARWETEQLGIEHVAVNVSSRQFRQPDFVDQVKEALVGAGVSPKRLMMELTEGSVIDNIDDTVAKMQALKKMGVEISIDDFGTGYSSLSYLKQLPLNQLKIDQNFVRDIVSDANDAVIVETIINMAKNLDLNVIAEGVETQGQMEFLLAKGCKYFQGYFFGPPVPADEMELSETIEQK